MKKGIWALLVAIPVAIAGLIKVIKTRKMKMKKADEDLMNQILEKQKLLCAACDDHEKMVNETIAQIEELKKRLDQPEYGIDPREIDISIPETEVV